MTNEQAAEIYFEAFDAARMATHRDLGAAWQMTPRAEQIKLGWHGVAAKAVAEAVLAEAAAAPVALPASPTLSAPVA